MKTCPNCQMTTDSHSECSVCGYDVTAVSHGERETEKYTLNKEFFKFLFKKQKFPLICIDIAVAAFVLTLQSFDIGVFSALLLSALCLLGSLYKNLFIKLSLWKYNEDYAESRYAISVMLDGVVSILFSVLSVALKYADIIYKYI